MTITVVGSPVVSYSASGISVTLAPPAGLQAGDVVTFQGTHQNQPATDWTLPSGWVRTGTAFVVNDANLRGTILAYHIVTSTDVTNIAGGTLTGWTFTFSATGRIIGVEGAVLRGVDNTNVIDAVQVAQTTSGNSRTMTSFTTAHDGSYVIAVANNQLVSPNAVGATFDSGWTQLGLYSSNGPTDNTAITRTQMLVVGKTIAATGATGSLTVTWPAATGAGITAAAFRAAPAPTNTSPTASITHSETGLSTTVNGSGSSDPDGTIASYDWNWGDGTTHGTGATPSAHAYATPGTYTITLTVTDNLGATGTTTASVTVGYPTATMFVGNGTAKVRTLVWGADGTTKKQVKRVWKVHPGLDRGAMISKPTPFVIGHMGCTWDRPEGSLQAVTDAMVYGVDAIMASVQRTSDGKFFLLNDSKYLDPVVLGNDAGTTLDPTTMTWSFIQANYTIGAYHTKATGQARQPFMLLTDLLAKFPGTIFLDPKTIPSTYWPDLLDIMDANGGPSRFIAKYYYSGVSWPDAAKARNALYKTWGYYYASEIDANNAIVSNTQSHWDYLGIDFGGSSTGWAILLATGKPVIGHIAKTLADYNTAISKGASGVMTSGVQEVLAP